jgi:5-carboxymethyl-2-hydroxymuconate isomerase
MPHLVILYTDNLEQETDMTALCRELADIMIAQRDDGAGEPVFPTGGTRVFAYPARHYAVADGKTDYAFVYLNLRMGSGRSQAVQDRVGQALLACTRAHFAPLLDKRLIGITLQIDEGREVFNARHSNIHPLFQR